MQNFEQMRTRKDLVHIDVKTVHNTMGWQMMWEWHEQIEIMYVTSGTGRCCIEDSIYTFAAGDLFIVLPHTLHKTELIDNQEFQAVIVIFAPHLAKTVQTDEQFDVLDVTTYLYHPHVTLHESEKERFEPLLQRMLGEIRREEGCSLNYLAALLQVLLIDIHRMYQERNRQSGAVTYHKIQIPPMIAEVIGYINENLKEELNLTEIAGLFAFNPSYLSRQFKNATGMTMTGYITNQRIQYAKTLLTTTDRNVSEIALDAGFNNVSYFNWVFKNVQGMSPRQYKKLASPLVKNQVVRTPS